jgi:lipopolysaccharide export system permease protein
VGREDIWIKSGRRLVHINFFDPVHQQVAGVTITTMGDDFKILSRVDAAKGRYEKGQWRFEQVIEQRYQPGETDYQVQILPEKRISLSLKPQDLEVVTRKTNEMSFTQLKRYVKKVEAEGYDATTYQVDMHAKIAFPFICIIMALAGAATGMRGFVKNNLPVAVALGVVICFFYWIMYGFCLSMGYAGILPPVVAAWVTNLFCLVAGALYLINTEQA